MNKSLEAILAIQELEVKMLRLMQLKKKRIDELKQVALLHKELREQLAIKAEEIVSLDKECVLFEQKIAEHVDKIKKLEAQQSSIKKIEEFNALAKEISFLEREKVSFEASLSDILDKKNVETEVMDKSQQALKESKKNSQTIVEEIKNTLSQINQEGEELLKQRNVLAKDADTEILPIYERLFYNKKSRVVVPIENRYCTGCHIALTPQHENLVRRGDKLVFCEHCSRIHYWPEQKEETTDTTKPKRRRRRVTASK